jgi:hypothetical protein
VTVSDPPPCFGNTQIVSQSLELSQDVLGDPSQIVHAPVGGRERLQERTFENATQLEPSIATPAPGFDRLGQDGLGPDEVTCQHQGVAQLEQHIVACRVAGV